MEAASARYATRDRFGGFGEPAHTPLQRYIRISVQNICVPLGWEDWRSWAENAVDPQNFEPNLALDLEIADIINSKKGNASAWTLPSAVYKTDVKCRPREAAVEIVNYINHRNANVSLLALTVHSLHRIRSKLTDRFLVAPGYMCQKLWLPFSSSD